MIKDKFCFVYVTVENFEQAELIAELAIKDKLVACANIFPECHSMFCLLYTSDAADDA